MPKATWGEFSSNDIDNAEQREGFAPYAGPLPRAGIYRFTAKFMKKGVSGTGNPKLQILWELDGTWKPEHKKYDACPLWDNMPVMPSTAWRVRAFCDALGLSSKEFQTRIIVDEEGKVTKLGSLGDPAGLQVYVNVSRRPASEGYDESLQLNGSGYLPIDDDDDDGTDDADDENGDDTEPPF
jgi:hypothetical protein